MNEGEIMGEYKNHFKYLMDMKSSFYTQKAVLGLNLKYGTAHVECINSIAQAEFEKSLNENSRVDTEDYAKLMLVAAAIGMDVDGDTVMLDFFIKIRDSLDQPNNSKEDNNG